MTLSARCASDLGGPTFYCKGDKAKTPIPIHAADSTMFCVEGYMNTPELCQPWW